MTTEKKMQEKINKAAEGYGTLAPAFIEGADFALDNQWISVAEDLPCNHEELSVFERETYDVIITGLNIAHWTRFTHLCCMLKNARGDWFWKIPKEYKITYWMPFPKYPKELIQLNAKN